MEVISEPGCCIVNIYIDIANAHVGPKTRPLDSGLSYLIKSDLDICPSRTSDEMCPYYIVRMHCIYRLDVNRDADTPAAPELFWSTAVHLSTAGEAPMAALGATS